MLKLPLVSRIQLSMSLLSSMRRGVCHSKDARQSTKVHFLRPLGNTLKVRTFRTLRFWKIIKNFVPIFFEFFVYLKNIPSSLGGLMLGRTSLLYRQCRQCLTTKLRPSPFLQSFGQTRSLKVKKVKRAPEDYPDHQKRMFLGPRITTEPTTKKIYLKDIEEIRAFNMKKLKGHKKGNLYHNSIHGKAELLQYVMRAYDREAMQREYDSSGMMLMLPSISFYLSRAY